MRVFSPFVRSLSKDPDSGLPAADTQSLLDEGYLLQEDLATVMELAGNLYDVFAARDAAVQAADN